MKRKDTITLGFLFVLTILTALFSTSFNSLKYVTVIILVLSGFKFLLVAFEFMELKKAHNLWKGLLIGLLVFFVSIISFIL